MHFQANDGLVGHTGNLHERQPEVVVQDEDRPLLDGQPPECPLELVAANQHHVARSADRFRDDRRASLPQLARATSC